MNINENNKMTARNTSGVKFQVGDRIQVKGFWTEKGQDGVDRWTGKEGLVEDFSDDGADAQVCIGETLMWMSLDRLTWIGAAR